MTISPEAIKERRLSIICACQATRGCHDVFEWFAKRELEAEQKAAPHPEDVEALAKVIFSNFGFYGRDLSKTEWVERGSSILQADARDIARAIIARYGAPPVAAPVEPAKPTQRAIEDYLYVADKMRYAIKIGDEGHLTALLSNNVNTIIEALENAGVAPVELTEERVADLADEARREWRSISAGGKPWNAVVRRIAAAIGVAAAKPTQSIQVVARPLSEWHEDMGDVLWWKFPVEEAPWVGTPIDEGQAVDLEIKDYVRTYAYRRKFGGWPGYHTHFTPLPPMPAEPIVAPDPAVEAGLATLPKDYLPSDRDIETAIRAALAVERRK